MRGFPCCCFWLWKSFRKRLRIRRMFAVPALFSTALSTFLLLNILLRSSDSSFLEVVQLFQDLLDDPQCFPPAQLHAGTSSQLDAGDIASVPQDSLECRHTQLRNISEKLPGFDPYIDVESWLWKPSKSLSDRRLPYGVKGIQDKVKLLSSKWKPSEHRLSLLDPHPGNRTNDSVEGHKKCARTCVVVGNSHDLLDSRLGRSIDAHDVVIRLNDAPTDPLLSDHVGARTSLRMFFPESSQLVDGNGCAGNEACEDSDYMMFIYKPADIRWLLLLADSNLEEERRVGCLDRVKLWRPWCLQLMHYCVARIRRVMDKIRVINPEILYEARRLAEYTEGIPTSGLITVVMALHKCSVPVSIAGFSYGFDTDPNEPQHYYSDSDLSGRRLMGVMLDPKSFVQHNIYRERTFLDRLVKLGLVKDLMVNRDQDR